MRGPGRDVWSAPWPQQLPLGVSGRLWVGTGQSTGCPPPSLAGSACGSLSRSPLSSSQATSPAPAWPRREPQQRSLQASHPRQLPLSAHPAVLPLPP